METLKHAYERPHARAGRTRTAVEGLLSEAGVTVDGPNPWDPQITDERFFRRVLGGGSMGLGDSYMDGWWECDSIDEFVYRLMRADLETRVKGSPRLALHSLLSRIMNLQSRRRARIVGERHYDTDNELFSMMLDPYMAYSCAFWQDACTLEEAQERKLELICRKLGLREGMSVLDIGCGWGSFARYAAERHGARVTGVTISQKQVEHAGKCCEGLPVDIRLEDYRSLSGSYDRVVSVGMFEHVGLKNYRTFMQVVHRCLKDGGLFLLHTIGTNESVRTTDPWIERYIFPNGMLPSIKQIGKAIEGLFVMEDWHSFGTDYDRTLLSWHDNFVSSWERISHRYDERFYRMWRYYLLACAGAFRARKNQLWQIVLSKDGLPGGYSPIRHWKH